MSSSASRHSTASELPEPAAVVGADRLFRLHSRYVAAFLRRLGLGDDSIDDAVQEVFLVACKRGGYRPGSGSARTWLGAITIRVAANARRTRQRRRETQDDRLLENQVAAHAPDIMVLLREELTHVERALRAMSDLHREVLLRFSVAGHSCDDIARSMGIPTGTVYSRLHAARTSFFAVRASLDRAA